MSEEEEEKKKKDQKNITNNNKVDRVDDGLYSDTATLVESCDVSICPS